MNESTTTQTTETVYRRVQGEPFNLFGWELPGEVWFGILGVVLLLAFFYVGWMYLKDSRGVGPIWATFLGLLRSAVYIVLAIVFLLPAKQVWEDTTEQSKVLVLFDGSTSVTDTRDDLPEPGQLFITLPTRTDKVLSFLQEKDFSFMNRLLEKNPVTAYRFGSRIDENYLYLTSVGDWTREEWEARQRELDPTKKKATSDKLTFDYWSGWLKPNRKIEMKVPAEGGPAAELKTRLAKLAEHNAKLDESGLFKGTNVTEVTMDTLSQGMNKMVQGIIVITDGRNSTPASSEAMRKLEERARSAKIPIFVVGVGTNRPQIRLDVVDLRAPKIIRPEDAFKAVVEVTGDGLADQPANVVLVVAHVATGKDGKEELLDIVLTEAETKGSKEVKRQEIVLGKKLILPLIEAVKFDKSSPPRVTAEFQFDAASLARAAGVDLTSDMYRGKKWEIAETKRGGGKEGDELVLQARIVADPREIFAGTPHKDVVEAMPVADKDRDKPLMVHVSEKTGVQVIRKPLQVLLFASGATRDYQFARALLVREMEKERVMLSIFLQSPPGVAEPRSGKTGIVQDVPAKRLLEAFPEKFDQPSEDEDEKLKDLSNYDVILAFDPDWTQLSEKQLDNVKKWVERGGGLVAVGGPINTLQLARPGANKDKLKPILDLYPVVLKDIRIDDADRKPDRPWPLTFEGATPEMEFLKLSDDVDRGTQPFLSDWQDFWGRNKDNPDRTAVTRGFYNFYPLEMAKTEAQIIARFSDPQAKMKDGTQMPFLVTTAQGDPRHVVWIGSGEMWRLRQYKETFHERFWTKLVRYVGTANAGKSNKRITLIMGRTFPQYKFVEVEVKADGRGGEPLNPKGRLPEVIIKVPAGVNPKEVPTDLVLKPKAGSPGWFSNRFQVRTPGAYDLEIHVPETNDTTPPFKFIVTPSNPELDNTRPDFDLMYQMASEAELVLPRMNEADRQELRRRLIRPDLTESRPLDKPAAKDGKDAKEGSSDDKMRLFFDLKNADLIPTCMVTDTKVARTKGPVTDYWDQSLPASLFGWELPIFNILALVVLLLSIEWLTRKLLRLA